MPEGLEDDQYRCPPCNIDHTMQLLEWCWKYHEAPELFEDQRTPYAHYEEDKNEAHWRNLSGSTWQRHQDFSNWCNVMMEDLGCSEEACRAFKQLAATQWPKGFLECSKVLYHALKDKSKDPASDENWSAWVLKSVRDSQWALDQGPDLHRSCADLMRSKGKGHELEPGKGQHKGSWSHGKGKGPDQAPAWTTYSEDNPWGKWQPKSSSWQSSSGSWQQSSGGWQQGLR